MSAAAEPSRTPEALRALGHQSEAVLKAVRRNQLICSESGSTTLHSCAEEAAGASVAVSTNVNRSQRRRLLWYMSDVKPVPSIMATTAPKAIAG
jgi:hypothetical protein